MSSRYADRTLHYRSLDPCMACGGDLFDVRRIYLNTGDGLVREVKNPAVTFTETWRTGGAFLAWVVVLLGVVIGLDWFTALASGAIIYGAPLLVGYAFDAWWKSTHDWVAEFTCRKCNHIRRYKPGDTFPREVQHEARHN